MESAKFSPWETLQDKRPSSSILKNHKIRKKQNNNNKTNMEEETIKKDLKDKITVLSIYACVINHSKT